MVHATVRRGNNDTFTVTFGEAQTNRASSPVAASGYTTKTMSAVSPVSNKSAPTDGLGARKVDPVAAAKAAAKAAIAVGKDGVAMADKVTNHNTELTTEVYKNMSKAGNKIRQAASHMLIAMLELRKLQVEPAAMQGCVTIMMYESKNIKSKNTIKQFTDLKNEFNKAMIEYEKLINNLENTVSVPVAASGTSATQLQKAEAEFNQIVETVKKASQDTSIINNINSANILKKDLFRTYNQVQLALDAGSNTNKQTAAKEKMTEGEDALILIYEKLYQAPSSKKGGRRTHRKRTPQKHRKRTHRNPRKRSLTVFRR